MNCSIAVRLLYLFKNSHAKIFRLVLVLCSTPDMTTNGSEWPSPTSSTATLSASIPNIAAPGKLQSPYNDPKTYTSRVIEYVASATQNSSAVYIYDVAEQVGFGTLTKEWAKEAGIVAPVQSLQTRPGAGLSLVGRLSQGTSQESSDGAVLTAYTTPSGLASMAASFAYLPPATASSRLVVQAPTVTAIGDNLVFSPTLAPVASIWSILPQNVTVLLSSTPQQSADFAALAYAISDSHVVHLFDHYSGGREYGTSINPPASIDATGTLDVALKQAGYNFFEYHGVPNATKVVIVLNGPLARLLKAAVSKQNVIGVVVVNVLRPWHEGALASAIPSSATSVHVLDDVPNSVTQGALYNDVLSSLWSSSSKRTVLEHRVTSVQGHRFLTNPAAFAGFVSKITSVELNPVSVESEEKKVVFFGVPKSPLSAVPHFIESLFTRRSGVIIRSLVDHDVFSNLGGITATRVLVSRKGTNTGQPVSTALPLDQESNGVSDFLGILDTGLLKTHSLFKHAKRGSTLLVVTSWTVDELQTNLPAESTSLILERQLNVYLFDAKALAVKLVAESGPVQDAIQNLLVELAFLRLYLGRAATEETILQLALSSFSEEIQGVPLSNANALAWASLKIVKNSALTTSQPGSPLRDFQFNAIAVESAGKTVVNGARLTSWHDAAKHLLFPTVYTPSEDSAAIKTTALRPDAPEDTFLVTCSVNRRLTPEDYDRNVFHLEFDTSGTGLKYAIGEALGVHGWNDEQEVLDFCAWYGVDPNRLITIPVPSDETRVHTRTVLQALQQQVDLFGRPGKAFYTDLADYATNDVDKYALRFIGSPEGSSTFKKLSEKDTVTFADVLRKYPSARPGIERLCELIEDIKPRHYSIASAQAVVGDRVDLLVVTVEWSTPSGEH